MNEPRTQVQQIVDGLRILSSYLSRSNVGDICAEHDEIYFHGVHRDALGGDDRDALEAAGWRWVAADRCWARYV